jgi:hypothetical protein
VALAWLKGVTDRLRGGGQQGREQREAQRRVRELQTEMHRAIEPALESGDRGALEALLRKPAELGVPEEEVELELEALQGALDALALRETVLRAGLPIVAHQHKAIGYDLCHFVASVFLASDGSDRTGRLFMTDRRLLFLATPILSLSWSSVVAVEVQERHLIIDTNYGASRYSFRCNSFADARCGEVIAGVIKGWTRGSSATAGDGPGASR